MIERIAFVDPCWRGGRLVVNADMASVADGITEGVFVMTYLLRWVKFSETRWAGIGRSARFCVRSLEVGLEGIIGICAKDTCVLLATRRLSISSHIRR